MQAARVSLCFFLGGRDKEEGRRAETWRAPWLYGSGTGPWRQRPPGILGPCSVWRWPQCSSPGRPVSACVSGEGGEGAGEVVPRVWRGERRVPAGSFQQHGGGVGWGGVAFSPSPPPFPGARAWRSPGTVRPFVGRVQQRLRGRSRSAGQASCGRARRSGVGQRWVVVRDGRGTRGGFP